AGCEARGRDRRARNAGRRAAGDRALSRIAAHEPARHRALIGAAMAERTPKRFALVAGEKSGDTLGAGLIGALRERLPDAEFYGVAGEQMVAAGCTAWYRAEELSVMGLAEVLQHL